ncbi:unnamed protein product [Notodromas monacha]|uniref:Fibronectin type-III domain-containing protein n=1 Tax=Notodromas monacha TaxID=399045 RepID=A0A7R9GEZ4_9CRUS|nr:unnamed protein product [Notodromas monacha]CAG0918787.1 unnamed protein product [Notodromas monacha]
MSSVATVTYDHTYDLYRKRTIEDAPLPLTDKPIISKMTDRRLVLGWHPYIPQPLFGPRAPPVTYVIEMADFPGDEWHTVQRGVRGCTCEIRNLEPFKDYKFRIRCENRYGVSEASPYAVANRSKIRPDPPTFKHYLEPGVKFRPDSSPYFPQDFDIERPPHDQLGAAPRFLRQQDDVQYGIKDQPANIRWFVYGYPKPVVHWLFNGEPVNLHKEWVRDADDQLAYGEKVQIHPVMESRLPPSKG